MSDFTTLDSPQYVFVDHSKLHLDLIVNGFSIKETIKEVLNNHTFGEEIYATDSKIEEIAEQIKEAFAVKLRLRQGEL